MNNHPPFKTYDAKKHKEAIHRIWNEVGWQRDDGEEAIDFRLASGECCVVEIDGEAEAISHTARGTFKYLDEDLEASCVTSVATSRIARKQGYATQLTAHSVALDALNGALISTLGIFEQGFYDQLGFGTGGYEHIVAFDPAELHVDYGRRAPQRLTPDDYEIVHQSRLNRMRGHGALNILPAEFTLSEMSSPKTCFGMGFFDEGQDTLSHHIWLRASNIGRGPYFVKWLAYQNYDQFLELLSVLKALGDQVHLIRMLEPQAIQMQDLIRKPLKRYFVSRKSDFESIIHSIAFWQIRICDLSACLRHTNLSDTNLDFNLILFDPIEDHLDENMEWRGLTGEYVIHLGSPSFAAQGRNPSLLTLQASVGAFTRMWLGVRPASGLSITDNLSAPGELLILLDEAFRLPQPKLDWDI